MKTGCYDGKGREILSTDTLKYSPPRWCDGGLEGRLCKFRRCVTIDGRGATIKVSSRDPDMKEYLSLSGGATFPSAWFIVVKPPMKYLNYNTPFGGNCIPLTDSVKAFIKWAKSEGYTRKEALDALKSEDGFDHGASCDFISKMKGFMAGYEARP